MSTGNDFDPFVFAVEALEIHEQDLAVQRCKNELEDQRVLQIIALGREAFNEGLTEFSLISSIETTRLRHIDLLYACGIANYGKPESHTRADMKVNGNTVNLGGGLLIHLALVEYGNKGFYRNLAGLSPSRQYVTGYVTPPNCRVVIAGRESGTVGSVKMLESLDKNDHTEAVYEEGGYTYNKLVNLYTRSANPGETSPLSANALIWGAGCIATYNGWLSLVEEYLH